MREREREREREIYKQVEQTNRNRSQREEQKKWTKQATGVVVLGQLEVLLSSRPASSELCMPSLRTVKKKTPQTRKLCQALKNPKPIAPNPEPNRFRDTKYIIIVCFPDLFFLQIRSNLPITNNGENLKQIIISLIIDQAKETNPFDHIKLDRPLRQQLKEDPNLVPLTGPVTQICR
jgi:hypothetical protein